MNYSKKLFSPNNTLSVYANIPLIITIAIATTKKAHAMIDARTNPLHRTMPIYSMISLLKKLPSSIMINPHNAPNFNTSQVLV